MSRHDGHELGKNKAAYIAFAVMSVLIVMLAFVSYYLRKEDDVGKITLTNEGIVRTDLNADLGKLLSEQSSEYTLKFDCRSAGIYKISLLYEAEQITPLGKYVTVEVKNGEERKASGNLGELLTGIPLIVTYTFEEAQMASLTVRYTMSEDLGDDAKGAALDFNLKLTVEKIG